MRKNDTFEVAIIGGGVTGTALLYFLSRYTGVATICLIEKYDVVGSVNSHMHSNSQTLHVGDIETNYTTDKARSVKYATDPLINYLIQYGTEFSRKEGKMVIAVGEDEVRELEIQFEEKRGIYPRLRKIDRNEISLREPRVMHGRNPDEKILALATSGYTVDFQGLARSFVCEADKEARLSKKEIVYSYGNSVTSIVRGDDEYRITKEDGSIVRAKTVVCAVGPESLLFAKQLGYGKHLELLPVAGSFYVVPNQKLLRGKVYTMQKPKLPFAAIHGDPELHDPSTTRFGPTAKVLPLLERHNYKSMPGFFRSLVWSIAGFMSLGKVISDSILHRYMLRNFLYDIPIFGKYLFLKEAQKIVPTLTYSDLEYCDGWGGIRPQIVNTKTGTLEMGDAQVVGENILFNITPSPGASICLDNARRDGMVIARTLNASLDMERIRQDFGRVQKGISV